MSSSRNGQQVQQQQQQQQSHPQTIQDTFEGEESALVVSLMYEYRETRLTVAIQTPKPSKIATLQKEQQRVDVDYQILNEFRMTNYSGDIYLMNMAVKKGVQQATLVDSLPDRDMRKAFVRGLLMVFGIWSLGQRGRLGSYSQVFTLDVIRSLKVQDLWNVDMIEQFILPVADAVLKVRNMAQEDIEPMVFEFIDEARPLLISIQDHLERWSTPLAHVFPTDRLRETMKGINDTLSMRLVAEHAQEFANLAEVKADRKQVDYLASCVKDLKNDVERLSRENGHLQTQLVEQGNVLAQALQTMEKLYADFSTGVQERTSLLEKRIESEMSDLRRMHGNLTAERQQIYNTRYMGEKMLDVMKRVSKS